MPLPSKKSELAFLLLPTLLLVGVAVALRHRAGASFSLPDNRFHLTITRIEFLPDFHQKKSTFGRSGGPGHYKAARPIHQGEEILHVYAFVAGEGNVPKWWLNDAYGRPDMGLRDVVFTDKNHKQTSYPCFFNGSGMDVYSEQHRYSLYEDIYVPKGMSFKGYTLTASAWVARAGWVRFSAPIDDTKKEMPEMFAPTITPGIKILKYVPATR